MSTCQSKNRSIAAGDGANLLQSRHAVNGFFDWPRDGDHHLVNRHHAIVDTYNHAGKVSRGEHRDGNTEGEINACHR